jgi:hypothetical protein
MAENNKLYTAEWQKTTNYIPQNGGKQQTIYRRMAENNKLYTATVQLLGTDYSRSETIRNSDRKTTPIMFALPHHRRTTGCPT